MLYLVAAGLGIATLVLLEAGRRGAPGVSAVVWTPAVLRFRRQDRSHPWPEDAVALFGSSTFRRWSDASDDLSPFPVVNRGFGGARMSDLRFFAHGIFGGQQPGCVVIYVANDISGSAWDVTPVRSARLLADTIARLRADHPSVPIIYMPTNPTPRRWHVWDRIAAAGDQCIRVCEEQDGVRTLDLRHLFLTEGTVNHLLFGPDNLHPNRDAYRLIAAELKPLLAESLGR